MENLFLNLFLGKKRDDIWWARRDFRMKFFFRCLAHPITSHHFLKNISKIENFDEIFTRCPLLPTKIHRPYLHKKLKAKDRSTSIISHYTFVKNMQPSAIKEIFQYKSHAAIVEFTGKDNACFQVYCYPCKYDKEGEITLTLKIDGQELSNLSFSFIRQQDESVAFISGLQGLRHEEGDVITRRATKSCYGMFPKRILYEITCQLLSHCGIRKILAVSEDLHVYRQWRYSAKKAGAVAGYNKFWEEIGGVVSGDFYQLPNQLERKSLEDIASKKRSEYRNRYHLLDEIQGQIQRF